MTIDPKKIAIDRDEVEVNSKFLRVNSYFPRMNNFAPVTKTKVNNCFIILNNREIENITLDITQCRLK